jgi:hypothetical protein
MSKYLANLLSKETTGFKKFINDIEHATGNFQHDLKLSSNLKQLTDEKIKSLGLNPDDTTVDELYYSLNNLVKLHDKFIINKIDSKYGVPTSAVLDQIAATFNKPKNRQNVFCIKSSTAKKILYSNHPVIVMNLLGYRSFDSMLKNEDSKILLNLAFYVEKNDWRQKYLESVKTLTANDFEYNDVKIIVLNKAKFKKISKNIIGINGHNIICLEITGQILVAQSDTKLKIGFSILTYAYIINRLKMMIKFSTFISNQRFNSNFGEIIYKLSLDNSLINFYLSKYNLSWDSIAELTSSDDTQSTTENDNVLLQTQTNNIDQLNKILINLEPALNFWLVSENLGYYHNGNIVSVNLLDACYNFYNKLTVENSSHVFMEIALNRTLIGRYLDSKVSNDQILNQINSSPKENEFIQIFKNQVVYS